MRIKENLSGFLPNSSITPFITPTKSQIGRVYGVITTENTPTKAQFEKYGGFNAIGTILYLDYNNSISITGSNTDDFFNQCIPALPISTDLPFPLPDELVIIQDAPAANTQESATAIQKYYTSTINIWNNTEHNAQPAGDKYNFNDFVASEDGRPLLHFEGDKIIQGRKGNSIRLGNTVKNKSNINEWSLGPGEDGDPITILTSGHNNESGSLYHVEQINKEYSSIYLTSTQKIPLITDRSDVINPITNPTKVSEYYRSQVMINADRVVINSKYDDVLIFASTNIELGTKYAITLNANNWVHLNSPKILLGTVKNTEFPDEPLILGGQMVDFLSELLVKLSAFCSALSSAKSAAEGADLIQIQTAAVELNDHLITVMKSENLDKLVSKQNFTV
jgi:hypothetical protein